MQAYTTTGAKKVTGGGGGGAVAAVVAGTNVTVDATDPANPIVAARIPRRYVGGSTVDVTADDFIILVAPSSGVTVNLPTKASVTAGFVVWVLFSDSPALDVTIVSPDDGSLGEYSYHQVDGDGVDAAGFPTGIMVGFNGTDWNFYMMMNAQGT